MAVSKNAFRVMSTLCLAIQLIGDAHGDISVPSGFEITSLDLGSTTGGLAVSSGGAFGDFVYVGGNGVIYRVNPNLSGFTTFATGVGSGGLRPDGMRFDSGVFGTGDLYYSRDDGLVERVSSSGAVSVFSSNNTLFSSNDLEFARPGAAFGNSLYVTNGPFGSGDISKVDSAGANSVFVSSANFANVPIGVGFPSTGSAFTSNLYSGLANGSIVRIDSAGAVTPFANGLGLPDGMAFSLGGAFGDKLYVADFTGHRILVVDSTGAETVFATGFNFNDGIDTKMAVTGDGNDLYITVGNSLVRVTTNAVSLPGDYNHNGVVDAADYVLWRTNQGSSNVLTNDPIGGTIGTAQYNQWRAHFGQSAGSGASAVATAAVPEPSTTVLLMFAAAGLCLRRCQPASAVPKLVNAGHTPTTHRFRNCLQCMLLPHSVVAHQRTASLVPTRRRRDL